MKDSTSDERLQEWWITKQAIRDSASDEIEKTKQKREQVAKLDEKDKPETQKIKQEKLTDKPARKVQNKEQNKERNKETKKENN